jgi:hypothetical protein
VSICTVTRHCWETISATHMACLASTVALIIANAILSCNLANQNSIESISYVARISVHVRTSIYSVSSYRTCNAVACVSHAVTAVMACMWRVRMCAHDSRPKLLSAHVWQAYSFIGIREFEQQGVKLCEGMEIYLLSCC